MKRHFISYCIVILSFISFKATGQDSIYNLIVQKKTVDTTKINLWNEYIHSSLYRLKHDSVRLLIEQALNEAESIDYKHGIANLLIKKGLLLNKRGFFDSSSTTYLEAISIFDDLNQNSSKLSAYINLGNNYADQNLFEKSNSYYLNALRIARKNKMHYQEGGALNNIGTIYYVQANYLKANEYFIRATEILDSIGRKDQLAMTYGNIGIIYHLLKDLPNAEKYINRSYEYYELNGDTRGMGVACMNLGSIFGENQYYDKALVKTRKAIKLFQTSDYKRGISEASTNLGDIYTILGRYDKALTEFHKSAQYSIDLKDDRWLSKVKRSIAEVHIKRNNYDDALQLLFEGNEINRKLKLREFEKDNYILISDAYVGKKDYKKALKYKNMYVELKDSILNENHVDKLSELETKYETHKKEKALEVTKLMLEKREVQIHKKNILIFTGIIMMFLAVISSHFIYENIKQKKLANTQLGEKNELLEVQHKNITSSITYAKRIQHAILPSDRFVRENFTSSFIWYEPKDIVSGDFYWAEKINNELLFAVLDCTGHGVPGAFMSIVGYNGLNNIVNERKITNPGKILDELHKQVFETTHHNENDDIKDGMDISLCSLNLDTNILQYAGAFNPLIIVRKMINSQSNFSSFNKNGNRIESNGEFELLEIKGNKQPIGSYKVNKANNFANHSIQLEKNDSLYVFSDGFSDQFGGGLNRKFMSREFRKLLIESQGLTMGMQKDNLREKYLNWKGENEQIDDICIIGYKVS